MGIRGVPHVVDRGRPNQLLGLVLGASIGIEDDSSLPGEKLHQSGANRLYDGADGGRVIVRGHTHQQVHFAHVHQLVKKIIR